MSHLNYREYGSGKPVIILHGLLGMLDNWHSFAKELGENYRVLVVDQRNHGRSFHTDAFNYKHLAEDLEGFIREHNLEKPHLIGHSMGGKTVLQFMSMFPDLAGQHIIVDIGPGKYPGGHEEIFKALLAIDLSQIKSRKEVQKQLMAALNDLPVVLFLMKNLTRHSDGYYEWKANIAALSENYKNILEAIHPNEAVEEEVLFVRGGNSNYINDNEIPSILEDYPKAEFKTVADAGHWVHADNREALLEIVGKYLNDGNG